MYKYCTYKFYLADGRRIAAFAGETNEKNQLKITLLYCSTQDQFSKKKAKYMYKRLNGLEVDTILEDGCPTCLYHPDFVLINVGTEDPQEDFMQYMRENYYQMQYEVIYRRILRNPTLGKKKMKGNNIISNPIYKTGKW